MKKNLRRLSILVSAQTAWNLNKLAEICGYGNNVGKMIALKGDRCGSNRDNS